MRGWATAAVLLVLTLLAIWSVGKLRRQPVVSPVGQIISKPLDKYTLDNLSRRPTSPSQIVLDEAIATTSAYTAYSFHFTSDGKKITGQARLPHGRGPFPVIVQLRGWVDRETYTTGDGTRRSGEVFATNGFIALAPDFLGYGGSDKPSADIFEERFQTYTTTLDLLASLPSLPLARSGRIGIWGHSNGGQIALTVLAVLRRQLPTVLWAPVSKPFPYSILYYTDEAFDRGKLLRQKLALFEQDYDVELYSLTNYLDRIEAPLLVQQGAADEAVPAKWSLDLVRKLKEKGKSVTYISYPGADHNLLGSWNTAVDEDVAFFAEKLK